MKHQPCSHILLFLLLPFLSFAQTDTIPDTNTDLIEDYIQNNEQEGEFDFNTIFEGLDFFIKKPINLNKTDTETLQELLFLSDLQIASLLNYIAKNGELLNIYELQAVPLFDLTTIKRILPYVKVGGQLDDINIPIATMIAKGKNTLFLRWARVLEQQKGYIPLAEDEDASRYLGDQNKFYLRFKHNYENRLSYGFTAEKDPGEEFFKGSNRKGFDYYSGHFFLKKYSQRFKAIALGDFSVSFGQGLILYSGFARAKGTDVTNIRRSGASLRNYTSVNESVFMRGAGVTIGLNPKLEATIFSSYKSIDGNILSLDNIDTGDFLFSSFQTSGLHRTPSEIEDRNALKRWTTGANIRYKGRALQVGLNGLYNYFDQILQLPTRLDTKYKFEGDRLLNLSVDYAYLYNNFNVFGETAISDNGGIASTNGILIALDKRVNFAALYRYFQRNHQTIDGNAFAETAGVSNENGLYFGLEINPNRNWKISGYFDTWQHPWLRKNIDAPSRGHEYLLRLTYKQRRKMELYLQYRFESKEGNAPSNTTHTDFLITKSTNRLRLHLSYKFGKTIELRNRVEFSFSNNEIETPYSGSLIYQDLIFKPNNLPLSINTRFAIFDIEDSDARIWAYENGLLNDFFVPAYNKKGSRFYLNLRYRGIRNLTVEFRYARTNLVDEESISSGLSESQGSKRSDIRAQIKYTF